MQSLEDLPRDSVRPATPPMRGLRASCCDVVRVGAMLAASVVITGCGGDTTTSTDETSVDVVEVATRSFPIYTVANGELSARNQVEIRSTVQRSTTIVEIVAEGTQVKKGDVLVRLNSDEIEREIEEEQLQIGEARLNLEAAESELEIQRSDNAANLRKAELKVELAELALEQWRNGDNVKMVKELETKIEKTKRDFERLDEKFQKSEELFERNFISYDEFKRDEIALLEAKAAAETAELELRVYNQYQLVRDREQKLSDLEEARQELIRVKAANEINLKNKRSRRENRAVQLGRRQESLDEELMQLEGCTIVAPTDGLVVYATSLERESWRAQSEGPLSVGRQVRNNDLLIVLPDTSEMVAAVKVHESLAARVRPGQRAEVKIEAAGLTIPASVESVGILAEGGGWRDPNRREYTVRVSLDSGAVTGELKPSMRCEAKLILGDVNDALTVPVQAVFSDGAVRYVYVENNGRFGRKPIMLGRRSDTYAEIRSGVDAGDAVLLRVPEPGEVVGGPFSETELTTVGYTIGENGRAFIPRRAWGGRRPAGGGQSSAKPDAKPDAGPGTKSDAKAVAAAAEAATESETPAPPADAADATALEAAAVKAAGTKAAKEAVDVPATKPTSSS